MMKKHLILAAVLLLSGCSFWGVNLLTDDEPEVAETQTEIVSSQVNPYLWQASLDKLAFMGIASQNLQEGRIETNWMSLPAAPNERFRITAEITSDVLRADALDVKAYKEVKDGGSWRKAKPSAAFEGAVEQAIITRAKVLYIQDKE